MNPPADPDDVRAEERALLGELRERLVAARRQESAARAGARRLARELALTRRLLACYVGARPAQPPPAPPLASQATVLRSASLVYHLDARENRGTHTALSGWAFRPAPGWDARATTITLLLRHEDTVYATPCRSVQRADVAAFYARQEPEMSGGATGLDGVGFACEIHHNALPAGTAWRIVLQLQCAGQTCEQFTGEFVRL